MGPSVGHTLPLEGAWQWGVAGREGRGGAGRGMPGLSHHSAPVFCMHAARPGQAGPGSFIDSSYQSCAQLGLPEITGCWTVQGGLLSGCPGLGCGRTVTAPRSEVFTPHRQTAGFV